MSSNPTSILRNKKRKRELNHVSFGNDTKNGTSVTIAEAHNKPSKSSSHAEQTSNWDDMEEDALDPRNEMLYGTHDTASGSGNEEQHIRHVKSARAIRRATTNDRTLADIEDDDEVSDGRSRNQGKFGRGGDGCFQGEEEADRHLSLLHEEEMQLKDDSQENKKEQCPIEPFNLQSEREDGMGYFYGDTYVFRKSNRDGEDEEDDAWLDQPDPKSKKEVDVIDTIANSTKVQQLSRKSKNKQLFDSNAITKTEIYQHFLSLLASEKETVMQALSRYGSIIKREKQAVAKRNRMKKGKGGSTVEADDESASTHQTPGMTSSSYKLESLTELASICMMKFEDGNIYDHDREYFKKYLNSSNVPVQWEYRGNQDNSIHGPYSTKQMLDWVQAGYFVGQAAVDVRIVKSSSTSNSENGSKNKEQEVNDLLNDLDSDDEEEKSDEIQKTQEWMRSDEVNFADYNS